jgi:hypothetical protein
MRPLLAPDLLQLWETGLSEHPLDRALIVLAAAFPELSWDDLADLSVGRRNQLLLAVREQVFGPRLPAVAQCPACQGSLELLLDSSMLRASGREKLESTIEHRAEDGQVLRFRLPNSRDLAAILGCADRSEARLLLLRRCLAPSDDAKAGPDWTLAESGLSAIAAQMAERDPQAEVLLDLCCPACGHRWPLALDIAAFFWTELAAQARRLLGEVGTLARSYGWAEADILSLSSARRRAYMEMAT